MTRLYLRILDRLYRWAWQHVPLFADYSVEFVHQVERRIHGRLMQKDWIAEARKQLEESGIIKTPP